MVVRRFGLCRYRLVSDGHRSHPYEKHGFRHFSTVSKLVTRNLSQFKLSVSLEMLYQAAVVDDLEHYGRERLYIQSDAFA